MAVAGCRRPGVQPQGNPNDRDTLTERIDLSDLLPDGVTASDGQTSRRLALLSGEEAQLTYSFRQRRGSYTWKAVRAVVSDRNHVPPTAFAL